MIREKSPKKKKRTSQPGPHGPIVLADPPYRLDPELSALQLADAHLAPDARAIGRLHLEPRARGAERSGEGGDGDRRRRPPRGRR